MPFSQFCLICLQVPVSLQGQSQAQVHSLGTGVDMHRLATGVDMHSLVTGVDMHSLATGVDMHSLRLLMPVAAGFGLNRL